MLDVDFLEPDRLRAFLAVVETGSFSRAAERLCLAQPTVSIQVRRLEETIGRQLLLRKSPAPVLTTDGEALVGYARELLEIIKRARLQFAQPPLEGSVRLGLVDDFNYTAFAEILVSLRRRHPRFELFVHTASTLDLHARLRTKGLDVVLAKRFVGGTEGETLCRQKMVWVGQPGVLRDGDDIVPLVLTPPNSFTRELILRALREAGLRWSIRFEAPSLTGLQSAVLAGLGVTAFGVGMIPPGLAPLSDPGALPPLEEAEFTLALRDGSKDPVVDAFADIIRNVAPLIVARLEEQEAAITSQTVR